MDKLEAMNAFSKVVALGSYAEAARSLGLTRSAVSKAVMELEHLLGARLLDRSTRRVSPTEAGLAYYEQCIDIVARVEETELRVSRLHDEPRGVLKINAPVSFGVLHLAPAVAEIIGTHPDLRIELALSDRFVDPIEEGVDVTVRIAQLTDSSLVARRLAPVRRVIVGSPDHLARFGTPASPEDLAHRPCLSYGHTTTLPRWHLTRDGAAIDVAVGAAMCSNNGDVLRVAALAGRGLTLLPTFLVGPDVAAGRLVTVLDAFPAPDLGLYALYAPNRYLAAKTRVFIDALVARFGPRPPWDRF
ncbi:LysR family transcriptional regulator [Siculibacillus lacustris]|uniref:LysR family transcriptional regulator n=1 Tax=Siculibacillus lacustris TaxID=1549641 RepID=A0A4Q9VTT4_9HYPH|nr:LysR family transcriptional regulator [Siculibacillus lacustris]TBW39509.1 LysR family transcriptional regulator [Siculibacillus lacustris]